MSVQSVLADLKATLRDQQLVQADDVATFASVNIDNALSETLTSDADRRQYAREAAGLLRASDVCCAVYCGSAIKSSAKVSR
jgi:hypothetical protein